MTKQVSARLSISVSESTRKALEELANEKGESLSGLVNSLISMGLRIETAVLLNGTIYAEDQQGKKYIVAGGILNQ